MASAGICYDTKAGQRVPELSLAL